MEEPKAFDSSFVRSMSTRAIEAGEGHVFEISEAEGFLSASSAPTHMWRDLFSVTATALRLSPWTYFLLLPKPPPFAPMRGILRLTVVGVRVRGSDGVEKEPEPTFASPLLVGDMCWFALVDDHGGYRGYAIMDSRLDCEARVLPLAQPSILVIDRSRHAHRCSQRWTEAELSPEPFADSLPPQAARLRRTKPRMLDAKTGRELQYANAEAQRCHWPKVSVG